MRVLGSACLAAVLLCSGFALAAPLDARAWQEDLHSSARFLAEAVRKSDPDKVETALTMLRSVRQTAALWLLNEPAAGLKDCHSAADTLVRAAEAAQERSQTRFSDRVESYAFYERECSRVLDPTRRATRTR